MQAIDQLQKIHLQIALGDRAWSAAIDWAIQRMLRHEEQDDLNVVMLAASVSDTEAEIWTRLILDDHGIPGAERHAAAALTLLPDLHAQVRTGRLDLEGLDIKLQCLLSMIAGESWMTELELQCECVLMGWEEQPEFDDFFDRLSDLCRRVPNLPAFRKAYHEAFTAPLQRRIQAEADEKDRWTAAARGHIH